MGVSSCHAGNGSVARRSVGGQKAARRFVSVFIWGIESDVLFAWSERLGGFRFLFFFDFGDEAFGAGEDDGLADAKVFDDVGGFDAGGEKVSARTFDGDGFCWTV